ncbi:nucleotidyl transferase AbiEii/AbiGii toxin family protein [Slackia exigua]|uniref:nucleotidyl transferase AbiEii/AbiGii toxin family protein n=1 Tax=Slackia exigua TaxID=84109 RepID=UPI003AB9634E
MPAAYVMQPFAVKLDYNGKPWVTVDLEVGHNEIGDADEPDPCLPCFVVEVFESIGLPSPGPVPLMPVSRQIAQKLHGLSEPGSKRAHDLIDLQLLVAGCDVDYAKTRSVCERLFAYRQMQSWPPKIDGSADWNGLYREQSGELDVVDDVELAVTWANELVERIVQG